MPVPEVPDRPGTGTLAAGAEFVRTARTVRLPPERVRILEVQPVMVRFERSVDGGPFEGPYAAPRRDFISRYVHGGDPA